MYAYFGEKFQVAKQTKLRTLGWNACQGWLICGGNSGLLQVLKVQSELSSSTATSQVDSTSVKSMDKKESSARLNLIVHQNLQGHEGAVTKLAWNLNHEKFASSDQNGLIIVWSLKASLWQEEMVNKREKSLVSDMKWTPDGSCICIVYEDGGIIVGSVEGKRIWGGEIGEAVKFVEWFPSGKQILIIHNSNMMSVYDDKGHKLMNLDDFYKSHNNFLLPNFDIRKKKNEDKALQQGNIVSIHWIDKKSGQYGLSNPTLAIGFDDGLCYLYKGIYDNNPIALNTNFTLTECCFSPDGSIVILVGKSYKSGQTKFDYTLQFYSCNGRLIQSIMCPIQVNLGSVISGVSWEGNGSRIALAVDSYLYFVNIKPDFKWGSYGSTIVYASIKIYSSEVALVFWNYDTDEQHIKRYCSIRHIKTSSDHCVVVGFETLSDCNKCDPQCSITIFDTVGNHLASKKTRIDPILVEINSKFIVCSDTSTGEIWEYCASLASTDVLQLKCLNKIREENEICCVCVSSTHVFFAVKPGMIHKYSLPDANISEFFFVETIPRLMQLNIKETKMSIIDENKCLYIIDLESNSEKNDKATKSIIHSSNSNDIWDMKWSVDDPASFAFMKDSQLVICNKLGDKLQKPFACNGYLLSFHTTKIMLVLLDEILESRDVPTKAKILNIVNCVVREVDEIIETKGLERSFQHFNNASVKIFNLISRRCLEAFDLNLAEKAFAKCQNYRALKFLRRLELFEDLSRRSAEIQRFFLHFDKAEKIFVEMDNTLLALELNINQGEWFRVLKYVQNNDYDPEILQRAYESIGEHYINENNWSRAAQYYLQSNNLQETIDNMLRADDSKLLSEVIDHSCDKSSILLQLGGKFEILGAFEESTRCYEIVEQFADAIECSANSKKLKEVAVVTEYYTSAKKKNNSSKKAQFALRNNQKLLAAELFSNANQTIVSAQIFYEIAQEIVNRDRNFLLAKKVFILSALELDKHKKSTLGFSSVAHNCNSENVVKFKLEDLLNNEGKSADGFKNMKILDNAWRGASACHYYILCHRQLYDGNMENAMNTAIRCSEFIDILGFENVFSILALTSLHNECYDIFSRSLIKLETNKNQTEEKNEEYGSLACLILTTNEMHASNYLPKTLISCLNLGTGYNACTITGRPIINNRAMQCTFCKHYIIESEVGGRDTCPLCHFSLAADASISILEDNKSSSLKLEFE